MITESIDFYKFTMGQVLHSLALDDSLTVEYTFKDRGDKVQVWASELRARLSCIRETGFSPAELGYLAEWKLPWSYLNSLQADRLPHVAIEGNRIATWGPPHLASLWETIVLSQVNALHYHRHSPLKGDARLTAKIRILQQHPEIQFSDFGTRRRFSREWHHHVLERLVTECPNNLIGTSNVGFAREFGLTPIGSFAHEMPMIAAALADLRGGDILGSQNSFFDLWELMIGPTYALTDTFTSDFFFKTFGEERARKWKGLRHDSGSPIAFADQAIKYYRDYDIDPKEKTILFSDGLNIELMLVLTEMFADRIGVVFGVGTNLTCDVQDPPTNIVMKATGVLTRHGYRSTVKLSDNEGKYTGTPKGIAQYLTLLKLREYQ